MIKLNSVSGFNYQKESYADFISSINVEGWTIHDLGETTLKNGNMLGMSWGKLNSKPTIYIQGQIHGAHEWRTSYWVRKFAEQITKPSIGSNKEIFEYLRATYSFFIIPCANPYGYEKNVYGNGNGVSLSRNFDFMWNETPSQEGTAQYKGPSPFSEPESRIVRDVIEEYLPVSMLCCHTWGGFSGFTTRFPQDRKVNQLIRDYFKSMMVTSEVSPNTDARIEGILNTPSVYNWAGEIKSRFGKKIFGQVLETGSLESEYEQARLGINGILLHCIYADKWLRESSLIQ